MRGYFLWCAARSTEHTRFKEVLKCRNQRPSVLVAAETRWQDRKGVCEVRALSRQMAHRSRKERLTTECSICEHSTDYRKIILGASFFSKIFNAHHNRSYTTVWYFLWFRLTTFRNLEPTIAGMRRAVGSQ